MGFRIGVIRDWEAKWYADRHYMDYLQEDLKLRKAVESAYPEAGVSLIEIDRQANNVALTIYTARPGILIGRGGQRVDELRLRLEELIGKRVQLNIREIQQPELDAHLVAKVVAEQLERRIAYRRAMKQAMLRSMQAGARGMRISVGGRLDGAEIARRVTMHEGQVPLHTLRADIDYGLVEARTTMGRIGVKVWIYKGDILPTPKVMEEEELLAEPVVEAAPAVEAEEKPAELVVSEAATVAPPAEPAVAEAKEVPAEAVAEAEEKPAKPRARRKKAEPSAEPAVAEAKEVPAEAVAEAEEKPAKPRARRKKAKPPAEPAVAEIKEVPAEAEEKPAKPRARRKKAEPPAEPAVAEIKEVPAEAEEKPAKPRARRKKEEPSAETVVDTTAEAGLAENQGDDSVTA